MPGDPASRAGSPGGPFVEPVVDVDRAEPEGEAGGAGSERHQQRGRIGSPGEGGDDRRAAEGTGQFAAPLEERSNLPLDGVGAILPRGRVVAVEGLEPPTQRI